LHKSRVRGPAELVASFIIHYDRKGAGPALPLWEGHCFITDFYMLKII